MPDNKKPHPSFDTDAEGHHYVPGRASGNADYFSRPIPPVRDSSNLPVTPSGPRTGKTDWDKVAEEIKKK